MCEKFFVSLSLMSSRCFKYKICFLCSKGTEERLFVKGIPRDDGRTSRGIIEVFDGKIICLGKNEIFVEIISPVLRLLLSIDVFVLPKSTKSSSFLPF